MTAERSGYLGFRPDLLMRNPTGVTDVYVAGRDRSVEPTVAHIVAAEAVVAATGFGGLSADGEYVPTAQGAEVTAADHHNNVIKGRHELEQS